ncbi:MAG: hypothetical protein R6W95_10705, partial [Desulfosarcina sp.]
AQGERAARSIDDYLTYGRVRFDAGDRMTQLLRSIRKLNPDYVDVQTSGRVPSKSPAVDSGGRAKTNTKTNRTTFFDCMSFLPNTYQLGERQTDTAGPVSVYTKTVISPDIFVMLKILSSEYQLYACGKIFRTP